WERMGRLVRRWIAASVADGSDGAAPIASVAGKCAARSSAPIASGLHRRRSQSIGGLLPVPALHSLPARLAAPDRDVEPACHGTAFDVFLILLFSAFPL